MPLIVSRSGDTTVISVRGVFDAESVLRLRGVLRDLRDTSPREPQVVIDLGRAGDVTPIALAALLEGSRDVPGLRFRGLSNHSAQVLGHLSDSE